MKADFCVSAVEKPGKNMEIAPDNREKAELFHIFHRLIHKAEIR
jgi:hypothetical protein